MNTVIPISSQLGVTFCLESSLMVKHISKRQQLNSGWQANTGTVTDMLINVCLMTKKPTFNSFCEVVKFEINLML